MPDLEKLRTPRRPWEPKSRVCTKCDREFPITEFYVRAGCERPLGNRQGKGGALNRGLSGRQAWCIPCFKPFTVRDSVRCRLRKMSVEQLRRMLARLD